MSESELPKILVSIVLPAYNAADFIAPTLDSLNSQTHSNHEVLVVDDCSTDATAEIVKAYAEADSRVRLLQLAENSGGPACPRNTGLKQVSGEYIAFIDADDLWHPEKLSVQLSRMSQLDLNFSSTRLRRFTQRADFDNRTIESFGPPEKISFWLLLKKNVLANSSVMLTAELAKTLRFSEHSRHAAIEDYLAWLELHKSPEVRSARLGERLVYYRIRDGSISRSKLQMSKKIYGMLSEIEVAGRPLGAKKYRYFLSYLWGSLTSKMFA